MSVILQEHTNVFGQQNLKSKLSNELLNDAKPKAFNHL